MSTKTISLRIEAYERLRQARRRPGESFSEVVMRAQWPDVGITAAELLELYETQGPFLSAAALERIEAAKTAATPREDKWRAG
jgi:hypothetical protein